MPPSVVAMLFIVGSELLESMNARANEKLETVHSIDWKMANTGKRVAAPMFSE